MTPMSFLGGGPPEPCPSSSVLCCSRVGVVAHLCGWEGGAECPLVVSFLPQN